MKCSCVSILSRGLQLILRNYYYWDDRRSHLMNGAGVPLELQHKLNLFFKTLPNIFDKLLIEKSFISFQLKRSFV